MSRKKCWKKDRQVEDKSVGSRSDQGFFRPAGAEAQGQRSGSSGGNLCCGISGRVRQGRGPEKMRGKREGLGTSNGHEGIGRARHGPGERAWGEAHGHVGQASREFFLFLFGFIISAFSHTINFVIDDIYCWGREVKLLDRSHGDSNFSSIFHLLNSSQHQEIEIENRDFVKVKSDLITQIIIRIGTDIAAVGLCFRIKKNTYRGRFK